MLSSWAVQKQAAGQMWPMGCSLPFSVLTPNLTNKRLEPVSGSSPRVALAIAGTSKKKSSHPIIYQTAQLVRMNLSHKLSSCLPLCRPAEPSTRRPAVSLLICFHLPHSMLGSSNADQI